MAAKGGRRQGAGRKPGSRNKITIEREIRAKAGIAAAVSSGDLPLDVMLKVMRGDLNITPEQYAAARDAAPYIHPRLAAVEHGGKDGSPIQISITDTDAKL